MLRNDPKQYFNTQQESLYGIYKGVVEDNNDPEKMGRCKVRIFGLHSPNKNKTKLDGIPTDELFWVEPALGLFEGGVTGFGSWVVPLCGAIVFVFFENGHIFKPRYFASCPGKPTDQNHGFEDNEGFSDPNKNYPNEQSQYPHKPNQLDEPDYHRLCRNYKTTETIVQYKNDNKDVGVQSTNSSSWSEPDSAYNTEYPNNKVLSSNSGITIEIDDTPGNIRLHIYHPSKTYIEIDNDGNVVFRNSNNRYNITDGDKKQHVMGQSDETVDSGKNLKIIGNWNVEVDGDWNVNTTGNIYFNGNEFHWND